VQDQPSPFRRSQHPTPKRPRQPEQGHALPQGVAGGSQRIKNKSNTIKQNVENATKFIHRNTYNKKAKIKNTQTTINTLLTQALSDMALFCQKPDGSAASLDDMRRQLSVCADVLMHAFQANKEAKSVSSG
jgi:hypothetical protein